MKKARTARPIDVSARAGAKKASMMLNAMASPINPGSGSLNFRVIRIPAATANTIDKSTSRVSKADQRNLKQVQQMFQVCRRTPAGNIPLRGQPDDRSWEPQPSLRSKSPLGPPYVFAVSSSDRY